MQQIIKITLAILLLLCLAPWPYGYFQLVRFAALIGFAILGYKANEESKQNEMYLYLALAILFQPMFKISLGRQIWNVIDVIVGVGLIISIFKTKKEQL